VILTCWDAARAEFLKQIALNDIAVRVVLLTRGKPVPAAQLPSGTVCLESRRVLRGEVVAL